MEPVSFESSDIFGVRVLPVAAFTNDSINSYIQSLDSGTREAVERNMDKFKSRDDIERFVHSLRR